MKSFIFYTPEGYCESPNNQKAENFQVLGIERGDNHDQALKHLLDNNPWIADFGYSLDAVLYKEIVN